MFFSPLNYSNLPPAPERRHLPEQLEIDTGRRRRITGLIAYLLFFATVAGLLVFVFLQFTPSVMLAVGLVSFMVLYMSVMGWVTSRNLSKRDFRKDF
jgi:FtsH-binding integral membrane protein